MILGPWKHSGNADYDIHGFALAPNALRYDIDLVCFRWIEHYLKGVENGIEKTPVVEYYTMGSGQWKTAENWPLPDGEKVTFYLGRQSRGYGSWKRQRSRPWNPQPRGSGK